MDKHDRQTDRQTVRQTSRQTDRQTDRQTLCHAKKWYAVLISFGTLTLALLHNNGTATFSITTARAMTKRHTGNNVECRWAECRVATF